MTKGEIITKIDNVIKLNGNIRATDTNEILKEILNFKEESLDSFELFPDKIIEQETMKYYYSFKGIKNHSCSLYFVFHKIKEGGESLIRIELKEEEYALLSNFLPQYLYSKEQRYFDFLTFKVSNILNEQNDITLTVALNIDTVETKKYYVLIGVSVNSNVLISTSVSLNYKQNSIINDIYHNFANTNIRTSGQVKSGFNVFNNNIK